MHKVVLWIQMVLVPTLGPAGIFVVAFLDSSFISVPEINDILVVTSSSAHPERAWLYVLMATLGSVSGCLVLWKLGQRGGEAFLVRRFGEGRVERTRAAFQKWDVLAIAIPSLMPPPMPFKIFVLSAGVFGFPWRRLVLTLVIARAAPLHDLGPPGRRLRRRGPGVAAGLRPVLRRALARRPARGGRSGPAPGRRARRAQGPEAPGGRGSGLTGRSAIIERGRGSRA